MSVTWLKFNDDKTEFIYLVCKQQLSKCDQSDIRVGDKNVKCGSAVRNVGVIFDSVLKFKDHVVKQVNSSSIRPYLNPETTATLVRAFISSHDD